MKPESELSVLEMEIDRIEDPHAREVMERMLKILKQQQQDIQHFWTYAEGVR